MRNEGQRDAGLPALPTEGVARQLTGMQKNSPHGREYSRDRVWSSRIKTVLLKRKPKNVHRQKEQMGKEGPGRDGNGGPGGSQAREDETLVITKYITHVAL